MVIPAASQCDDTRWCGDGDVVVAACDGGGGGGKRWWCRCCRHVTVVVVTTWYGCGVWWCRRSCHVTARQSIPLIFVVGASCCHVVKTVGDGQS